MKADPTLMYAGEFVRLRSCKRGVMLYNANDTFIGRGLDLYGESAEIEISFLVALLRAGDVVVDAGANIGTHTVAFAKAVGRFGTVHAFEPQAGAFAFLSANVMLNECLNVVTHRDGLGREEGIISATRLSLNRPGNFGGVELGSGPHIASLKKLDSLGLTKLALLKADVEGMETEVLRGARATILRCRPILYLEADREEKRHELLSELSLLGYRSWWHVTPLYNPGNVAGNKDDVFKVGQTSYVAENLICVHDAVSPGEVTNVLQEATLERVMN